MKIKTTSLLISFGLARFVFGFPIQLRIIGWTLNFKQDFDRTCDEIQCCEEKLEMLNRKIERLEQKIRCVTLMQRLRECFPIAHLG